MVGGNFGVGKKNFSTFKFNRLREGHSPVIIPALLNPGQTRGMKEGTF